MNFRVDRWSAVALRRSGVVLTTVGALLLSSCGGGGQSSQSEQFDPRRMVAFGDESSLLLPPTTLNGVDALKYSNNGFGLPDTPSSGAVDCRANQIWVQILADEYDLVFAECNPDGLPVNAEMRATAGAKVADVAAAVDAFLALPGNVVRPTDLFTLMVGTHDILELFASVNSLALTQSRAVAAAQSRARLFAAQVDRLTNRDNTRGRLLYSTVPEVNLTPFGRAGTPDDRALLKLLTDSFNDELRFQVYDNGRSRGFVNTSQLLRNLVDTVIEEDEFQEITNATSAVCNVPDLRDLRDCTPGTLVLGGTATSHVWAGDINFGAVSHILIGSEAVDLTTDLPW